MIWCKGTIDADPKHTKATRLGNLQKKKHNNDLNNILLEGVLQAMHTFGNNDHVP